MKRLTAMLIFVALALQIFSLNALAEDKGEVSLPKTLPLFLTEVIESGELEVTDEVTRWIELYDTFYTALRNFETEIDVSDFKISCAAEQDFLFSCYHAVLYNSDLCITKRHYENAQFYAKQAADGSVTDFSFIKVNYAPNALDCDGNEVFDRELAEEEFEEYETLMQELVAKVPKALSDVEKALFLHDYIATEYEYINEGDDTNHEAYSFLKEKHGVCDAYAETYNKALELLGIPALKAISDVGAHAWSVVRLDGECYHIDCTWGDPVPDRSGRASHNYFLVSDQMLGARDEGNSHSEWYIHEESIGFDVSCTSTRFDSGYIWSDAVTVLGYYNGEAYYIDDTSRFYEFGGYNYADISGEIRKTTDFKSSTLVKNFDSGLFYDAYWLEYLETSLYMVESQIYYNDSNSINYYDANTGESGTVLETKEDSLAGFKYLGDGKLEYSEIYVNGSSYVFLKQEYDVGNMGLFKNDSGASLSENLVAMRKYLINGNSSSLYLLRADVSGNDGKIDLRDLVALKRMLAE